MVAQYGSYCQEWPTQGRIWEQTSKGNTVTFDGTVRNGTIVLDQGATLLEGTRVTVVANTQGAEEQPTHLSLLKLVGMAKDLPADFAAQHDHYIHGTLKR